MTQVVVRRRPEGRLGSLRYRMTRWLHRYRPQFAVVVAFAVAALLGVVAASIGVQSFDAGSQAQAEAR